ncbi:MAG: hypothetical protein M0Z49_14560 [Chloroflexi bacterium]|nr:hypothetical protein [Chloroflexota bacterium]
MEIANHPDEASDAPGNADDETTRWIEAHRVRGVRATLDDLARVAGHSGGHTTIRAERDEGSARPLTDGELRAHVTCALAAGVAERLLLGQVSTGISEDAQRAGQLLLQRLDSGMDRLWPVAWPSWMDLGPAMADRRGALLATAMEGCLADAENLLEQHPIGLERLARRLLEARHLEGTALRAALVDALEADDRPAVVPRIA